MSSPYIFCAESHTCLKGAVEVLIFFTAPGDNRFITLKTISHIKNLLIIWCTICSIAASNKSLHLLAQNNSISQNGAKFQLILNAFQIFCVQISFQNCFHPFNTFPCSFQAKFGLWLKPQNKSQIQKYGSKSRIQNYCKVQLLVQFTFNWQSRDSP